MMRRIACLLLVICLKPAVAGAISDLADCPRVRVGFAGQYKVGVWTPVDVVFGEGTPPDEVTVTVADGDGAASRVSTAVRKRSVRLYVRFGRIDGAMIVSYRYGDDVPTVLTLLAGNDYPSAMSAETKLIVTVGADSLGVGAALEELQHGARQRFAVASLPDYHQLPDKWCGYEGVDALVLSTSRPDVPMLSEAQAAALDHWVAVGGRLVLCVGLQGETMLAEDSPLRRFAPGRFATMVSLRRTGALETFTGSSIPVPPPADGARLKLDVPRLAGAAGVVEAREVDLPLVVRTPRGFGQIVFFAADLDLPPLAAWKDRPKLAARLLDLPQPRVEQSDEGTAVMHYGFDDMSGQLRSALDRFDGVRPAPFSLVVLLIVLYLLAIGPADYFFLRKLTRRMQWTWITFPVIVLAFCVAAYALAYGLKGNEVHVHQADLVDVDAVSGMVRGTSWASVFSPRTERFNLSLRPKFPDDHTNGPSNVLVSWLGLPGEALGGMNPRAASPVVWNEQYDFSPGLNAIEGMPIQVWSTKSLVARWTGQTDASLSATLVKDGSVLSGTITNTLDFPLSGCVLAYRRWAYDLGTLKPGQSARVGPMVKRSELKTFLTGRKIIFDEEKDKYHQEATPYDRSSVDAAYVLRAMLFFDAAGGRRYTGLANGYQGFVDLSGLLKTDCAVLVGRAPDGQPAADWLRDGGPIAEENSKRVTMFRFVFPVERSSR